MIARTPQPAGGPGTLLEYFENTYKPNRLENGNSDRVYRAAISWFDDFLGQPATTDAALLERVEAFREWLIASRTISLFTAAIYARAINALLRAATYREPGAVPLAADASSAKLGAFLDAYVQTRGDVKPSTLRHLERAADELIIYFGADRLLSAITSGDADEFRRHLASGRSRPLADATVRRFCGRGKQFFRAAVRKGLIGSSPFGDMKRVTVRANRERSYFVSRAESQKVLDACPDTKWRLIFALSRFGGLRCPSETLLLRWSDIDWQKGRMRIRSPKTEHQGREWREAPIFAELRPFLEAAQREAAADDEFCVKHVQHLRNPRANLRQRLYEIIVDAGLQPWPKVFHNLRATWQTELTQRFPAHVVCEWLGNSTAVAMEHYLRSTEEEWQRAAGNAPRNRLRGLLGRIFGAAKGGDA